ncbi:flagellar protein FliT [Peribacillus glennii]|uniref:Flagellar protein FliT n=1 Tax=Peribacillus glennii TaxID=2303991 RepID=A0A372LD58_9BACI|nr:flagellar protein FliT [Peribacillus glennii]RFU63939.1 flagellar protein FliT [Peribacillus glennii]
MSPLRRFYETTLELIDLLEGNEQRERDEKIVLIEELLSLRDQLIKSIHPPYTEEEKELGLQLIALNNKLNILLTGEKAAIQKDIKQLSVKKESTSKYINPYQSFSTDGMFYDKRK